MDVDFDEIRPVYRLCRAGFGLMALALGLLCIDSACYLIDPFRRNPELQRILASGWWSWLVGAPITWGSLIGSYALWGRWKAPIWQRRAGLLVLLNFLDLISWAIHHSADLGLKIAEPPHPWLRENLTIAFGWVELYLTAALATDLIVHLGHRAPEFSRAAASFAMVGLTLSVLFFVSHTAWDLGWPLRFRGGINTPLGFLLWMGRNLVTAATSFLVTALCLVAAGRCGEYLAEIDRHANAEHDLLKSRSETEDNPYLR